MKYLESTLPTPSLNLACDEALLEWCDEGFGHELLRFWEPETRFVVLGYANKVAREVDVEACRRRAIPILRRCSGGGTILQGPGCLNYSLVLRIDRHPALAGISETNRYILEQHRAALARILTQREAAVQGYTDLTLGDLKFSGNAQRRKRHFLLFHGTFLYDFDIAAVEPVLRMPSAQPDYRQGRSHAEFLRNVSLSPNKIRKCLRAGWQANEPLDSLPLDRITQLDREKYSRDEWNFKF